MAPSIRYFRLILNTGAYLRSFYGREWASYEALPLVPKEMSQQFVEIIPTQTGAHLRLYRMFNGRNPIFFHMHHSSLAGG